MTNEYQEIGRREIVTTRVLDTPPDLVFEAWTDPERLTNRRGPHGFTNTVQLSEFNPGGLWSYTMHGPDGTDYRNETKLVEIVKPERVVPDHLSSPRFRLTALFEELRDRTKLTFQQLFETAVHSQVKDRAIPGNEDNLDRLGTFLVEKRPAVVAKQRP